MSRFTPTINDKNVACLVKKVDGTACNHLMKWAPSEDKRGTGTSGMTTHIQNSSQAERNFSALAHLIGDLRSNMLASKVERMMFIRLNRHLVDEVHELDAANAQARARVAKSAQKSAAAQQERSNMSVDLALQMSRMAM